MEIITPGRVKGAVIFVNEALESHDEKTARCLHGPQWKEWVNPYHPQGLLDFNRVSRDPLGSRLLVERTRLLTETETPRNQKVLELGFGLETGQPFTLPELAKELGVSTTRARTLKTHAFLGLSYELRKYGFLDSLKRRCYYQTITLILNALDREFLHTRYMQTYKNELDPFIFHYFS